ncbi:MAG: hydroxymethylbilane synthase [Thaumarchaeota archaeon]|nr:hydroxymethylbilane synthase [Nitrososphaerota archaeon]
MRSRLMVGTRGSRLALAQTRLVVEELEGLGENVEFVTVPIKTVGDVVPAEKLGDVDGKTAFTGDIDRQVVDGRVDFAVHSMKDLPASLDERLVVAATPVRGDARDALVSASGSELSRLKLGARVGTSSVRRRAQLLAARRDLKVVEMHGNVETRLRKMDNEHLDGVVIAAAGLKRLGLESRASQLFSVDEMVPAVCQGVLAVEARRDDRELLAFLRRIDDPVTRASSECERSFSEKLGGDCDVPLGAFASVGSSELNAVGMVADTEGLEMVKVRIRGGMSDPKDLGRRLAAKLSEGGGGKILKELRS